MTLSMSGPDSLSMRWQQLIRGTVDEINARLEDVTGWREAGEREADRLGDQLKQWSGGEFQKELLLEYRELRGKLSRAKRVQRVLEGELARRKNER